MTDSSDSSSSSSSSDSSSSDSSDSEEEGKKTISQKKKSKKSKQCLENVNVPHSDNIYFADAVAVNISCFDCFRFCVRIFTG